MRCESSTRCSISASLRSASVAALALLLGTGSAAGDPVRERPVPVASYTLHAKLDESEHRVLAHGRISLDNFSASPLSEIYLHLYMNAFKNDETLFLRS